MNQPYDSAFYDDHSPGARESARVILPLLIDFLSPRSMVDVGCGTGAWLGVAQQLGVRDVTGVDGDYVPRDRLEIPESLFRPADLLSPPPADRRFDVAISLELAEHLPETSAEPLVSYLCELAPVVVFSAAIPKQGGRLHVNEQWPSYWSTLFETQGYRCVDAIRMRVWEDERVEWWYAQNTLLFVHEDELPRHAVLAAIAEATPVVPAALVHPKNYMWKAKSFVFDG